MAYADVGFARFSPQPAPVSPPGSCHPLPGVPGGIPANSAGTELRHHFRNEDPSAGSVPWAPYQTKFSIFGREFPRPGRELQKVCRWLSLAFDFRITQNKRCPKRMWPPLVMTPVHGPDVAGERPVSSAVVHRAGFCLGGRRLKSCQMCVY